MLAISNKLTRASKGFTLVELVVVMTVMGTLTGLVLTALGDYYQATTTSLAQSVNTTENRTSLRVVQTDLTATSGFLDKSFVPTPSPLGVNGTSNAWSYEGSGATKRVLIAKANAIDKPTDDLDRMVVFKANAGNCNINTAIPIQVNYVYYVAPAPGSPTISNLYRKTLVEQATPCQHPVTSAAYAPYQKTTCGVGISSAQCGGVDAVILKNVKSFSVDYFASANDQVPIPDPYLAVTDPLIRASISSAAAVRLNVVSTNVVSGKVEDSTSSIRISRYN